MRKTLWTISALIVVGMLAAPTLAQEKKGEGQKKEEPKKEAPKAGEKKDDKGGAPSPEELKMLEEMAKMGQPGEHHKALAALAGKWTSTGKYKMAPEQPWKEFKSAAEFTAMFDGRFVTQKVKGDPFEMPGMPPQPPFEGFGVLGYDNGTKKHTSFWMDNMGTMMMIAEGTCSANCKEITMDGTMNDCMTGQPSHVKTVYKFDGNDKFTLSMFGPDATGKDFLSMEITYNRAK